MPKSLIFCWIRLGIVGAVFFLAGISTQNSQTYAIGLLPSPPGYCQERGAARRWWSGQMPFAMGGPNFSSRMRNFILNDIYRDRIVNDWWTSFFQPSLQLMTAQITASSIYTAGMTGALYDGVSANRATLALQTLEADAYKSYTPGEGLCRFGTLSRSLASADMNIDATKTSLASISQARQLGTRGGSADAGIDTDRKTRINQFIRIYCDPGDNDGKLGALCGQTPASMPARFNKDINITRTLLQPATLQLNFKDGSLSNDEEDVLALASNLYGHDVIKRLLDTEITDSKIGSQRRLDYLDLRQLVAVRNVAQSSYNAAAARRSLGDTGAGYFMIGVLRELGFSEADADRYLDNNNTNNPARPSYNAQMEILTKRIYQNPNFYAGLIDKPANIDRQQASMQAIGLMQDRDISQSLSRQELLLSLLLEMKLRGAQREVERTATGVVKR